MTRWLAAALTLALLVPVLAGCSSSESLNETTSREAVSSATVDATATVPAEGGAGAAATGVSPSSGDDIGQTDLQAELEAIERELDAMVLPDDADFGDIESALQ